MGWYTAHDGEINVKQSGNVKLVFTCPSCDTQQSVDISLEEHTTFYDFCCSQCVGNVRGEMEIRYQCSYRA